MVYLSKEVTNKDKSLKTQLQLLTGDKQKADTKKNIYIYIFFLSGFSFTNIHNSRDSRGRGRVSI